MLLNVKCWWCKKKEFYRISKFLDKNWYFIKLVKLLDMNIIYNSL